MQLMLYETAADTTNNDTEQPPVISKLDLTESISNDKLSAGLKMEREKVNTGLESHVKRWGVNADSFVFVDNPPMGLKYSSKTQSIGQLFYLLCL